MLAAVAYGGVLAWSCALAPKVAPLTASLGGVGGVLLAFVLVRGHDDLLPSALLMLGACYVLGLLAGRHALDQGAPLIATGLLACSELATWSLEQRPRVPAPRSLLLARAGAIGVLLLGGLAASTAVLVVSAAPIGSGLAWTLLGALAAVLTVGLAARLSTR